MCLICFADFWCIFTRRHQRGEKGKLAEWFIRTTYNYVERRWRKIVSGHRILENFITARKESVFYILSCTLLRNQLYSLINFNFIISLRGRRLKGKGKGVLCARETRFSRVSLAPKTPFPKTPFPFPFKRLPRRLRLTWDEFSHINHKPDWICHQKPARTLRAHLYRPFRDTPSTLPISLSLYVNSLQLI